MSSIWIRIKNFELFESWQASAMTLTNISGGCLSHNFIFSQIIGLPTVETESKFIMSNNSFLPIITQEPNDSDDLTMVASIHASLKDSNLEIFESPDLDPNHPPTLHPFFSLQQNQKLSKTKSVPVKAHFCNGAPVSSHIRQLSKLALKRRGKRTKSKKHKVNWETRPDPQMIILQYKLNLEEAKEAARKKDSIQTNY